MESAHFRRPPDRRSTPHRLPGRELVALLLAGAALASLRAQSPVRDGVNPPAVSGSVLGGRIVAAETGQPIRKARVDLVPHTGERPDPVFADHEGRFAFAALPAGRYTLSAWKSGYALTTFGARTFWEPAGVIAVDAGQSIEGLVLALARGGVVSGRVMDDAGEPVTDMTVSVGRATPVNGRLQFQMVSRATSTDDRGEYRIGGLPPGSYFVSAAGRLAPSLTVPGTDPGFRSRSVFYPQTPFLSEARAVPVRAGEEVGSIDIAFSPETLVTPTISGRVIDPRGVPVEGLISVTSSGGGVAAAAPSQGGAIKENGEFSLRLVPGDYQLMAQTGEMMAKTRLVVDRIDIGGVELVLAKGGTVTGRVVFEGAARRPPGLEVVAWPLDSRGDVGMAAMMNRPSRVRSDGTFRISNLLGAVEFRVLPESRGWQPKAIMFANRNIIDTPLEFKGGEDIRNVTIVLTDRSASLAGTVTNMSDRAIASGLSVLLFPSDLRQAAHRARWVRPDQHGRFLISDLAPGDYLVAAATDVDDGLWRTPAHLERFRARATSVTLADGDAQSITIAWSEQP